MLLLLTTSGCSRAVISRETTVVRPVLSMNVENDFQSPAIPGTGILSHDYEEREVARRISCIASAPAVGSSERTEPGKGIRRAQIPVSSADRARTVTTADMSNVYAMSRHAHLLSSASRPRMISLTPLACTERISGDQSPSPELWNILAREAEEIFGLDAALILAVIRTESDFDHKAESHAGAQGAMQIMPDTQEVLGLIDPFDPRANVYAGSQYLMQQFLRFGSPELALAAYNAGPGNVRKYGGIPPFAETQNFVRKVLSRWKEEKSASAVLPGGP